MITTLENMMKLYRAARQLEGESTDNSVSAEYKTLAIAALLDEISRTACDMARATHAEAEKKRTEAACKAAARKIEARQSRKTASSGEQRSEGEGCEN